MSARAQIWGVPLSLGAGAITARLLVAHAPARIASDLAQPLPVVTAWGSYGSACFAILALAITAATCSLLAALGGGASRRELRFFGLGEVALAAAAAIACAYAWPFVFSSDTYAYAAYGALSVAGADPYAPVAASAHGALVDAARRQWDGAFPPCVYGPLFVAVARAAVVATQGLGPAATLWLFRGVAAAAFLASLPLLDVALAAWAPARRPILRCAYALNPVVLWTVAEGHNDALLLLAICVAAALLTQRVALGALALGLTPLVKAPGAAIALAAALGACFARSPRLRAVPLWTAGGLLFAVALALPPLAPALNAAARRGHYAPQVSLQGLVGPWAALAAAAAAALLAIGRLARRRSEGYAWLGIAVVAALPNEYPWYGLWLGIGAVAGAPSPAARALWGATIFSVVRYLPDANGHMGSLALHEAAAVAALPLAFVWARSSRQSVPQKAAAPT